MMIQEAKLLAHRIKQRKFKEEKNSWAVQMENVSSFVEVNSPILMFAIK